MAFALTPAAWRAASSPLCATQRPHCGGSHLTLPRPSGAAAAAVIAGSLWGTARRARLREGDDCSAVQRWVDSMIIGLRLCPYAQPAKEAGRLRVVSSDGKTGLAVLDDIVAEASSLN
ncbi:hypothetical protein AK812_SmicGene16579 [Symbiodinium microadriaticum]|uniref:Uncharacterized protein n=1 Tax=Symbiodinium microadriaticum TaxID=2951 RepID=A0A1Q9E018_SYMMI|nr:hypothetical protein AK812_SmicGene16579 [Symbiodinium microadriaticum]